MPRCSPVWQTPAKPKLEFKPTTESTLCREDFFTLSKDFEASKRYQQRNNQAHEDDQMAGQSGNAGKKEEQYYIGHVPGIKQHLLNSPVLHAKYPKGLEKLIDEELERNDHSKRLEYKRVLLKFDLYEQKGYRLREMDPDPQDLIVHSGSVNEKSALN